MEKKMSKRPTGHEISMPLVSINSSYAAATVQIKEKRESIKYLLKVKAESFVKNKTQKKENGTLVRMRDELRSTSNAANLNTQFLTKVKHNADKERYDKKTEFIAEREKLKATDLKLKQIVHTYQTKWEGVYAQCQQFSEIQEMKDIEKRIEAKKHEETETRNTFKKMKLNYANKVAQAKQILNKKTLAFADETIQNKMIVNKNNKTLRELEKELRTLKEKNLSVMSFKQARTAGKTYEHTMDMTMTESDITEFDHFIVPADKLENAGDPFANIQHYNIFLDNLDQECGDNSQNSTGFVTEDQSMREEVTPDTDGVDQSVQTPQDITTETVTQQPTYCADVIQDRELVQENLVQPRRFSQERLSKDVALSDVSDATDGDSQYLQMQSRRGLSEFEEEPLSASVNLSEANDGNGDGGDQYLPMQSRRGLSQFEEELLSASVNLSEANDDDDDDNQYLLMQSRRGLSQFEEEPLSKSRKVDDVSDVSDGHGRYLSVAAGEKYTYESNYFDHTNITANGDSDSNPVPESGSEYPQFSDNRATGISTDMSVQTPTREHSGPKHELSFMENMSANNAQEGTSTFTFSFNNPAKQKSSSIFNLF